MEPLALGVVGSRLFRYFDWQLVQVLDELNAMAKPRARGKKGSR
jgi:hypothetical protein